MKHRHLWTAFAASAALVAGLGQASAQKTYTYGQWLPPKHNVNLIGLQPMFDELAKKGLKWNLVTGGQLFSAKATLKSVGNRTAEAGLVVPSYARTSLKHAYIVADMLMLGKSDLVMNAAAMETYFMNCPQCMDDYKKVGTIFLSGYAAGGYSLLLRTPIKTISEAKGIKMRTTGALGRLARALGGNPISMTMGDVPEAIKRGQIDCIIGPIAWLKSYPIQDSVKTIYDLNHGAYPGLGLVVMNRKAWDEYTDDQKRIFWGVQAATSARTVIRGYNGDDLLSRAMAKKMGIPIIGPEPALDALLKKHMKNEVATVIRDAKKLKVKNPEKIVNAMLGNIKKWTEIVDDAKLPQMIKAAGSDVEKLDEPSVIYGKLLQKHIFDKVDPTKL